MRVLIVLLLPLLIAATPARAGDHWTKMGQAIAAEIAAAEQLALSGKPDEAKKAVTAAYFGKFESEKMEAAMRKAIGSKPAYDREKQFGDLRKLIASGTPDEIKALSASLRAGLVEDGKALDKAGVSPDVFAVNQ